MENFPGNSHSSRTPEPAEPNVVEKKVEKVITGTAVHRRRSLGKRLFETFVGGHASSAWSHVRETVLVPAMKDTLSSMISQWSDRLIFGDSTPPRRNPRPSGGSPNYTNYTQYSNTNARRREDPRPMSYKSRQNHNFNDIEVQTRDDANATIDNMAELAAKYGQVTLTDFYNLVGVTPTWQDDKFGWKDISGFGPVRRNVQTGWFMFDFPPPEQLE